MVQIADADPRTTKQEWAATRLDEVKDRLEADHGDWFEDLRPNPKKPYWLQCSVDRHDLKEAARYLHDIGFEHCSSISAMDWGHEFGAVYHLMDYDDNVNLEIDVRCPKDDPTLPTVSDIWGGADFHEREGWDLMGVVFAGHPNLKRILLPEDTEEGFHPLRKEYDVGGNKIR